MVKHTPFRSPVFWLGLLLLAPFVLILAAPGGRVLGHPQADNPSMFYYYNDFAGQCWRQGSVPLWNPYIMLGQAFLGEGQAALFHPLSWLFIALPTGVALNWINALCFVMGGLFFYGWLRALGLARDSSLCGALAWGFSNFAISRIYSGHLTNTLIFFELPAMLMFWERWRATGRAGFLAGLGLAYAGMILAAHPQFLYIFSLFFLIYVLAQMGCAMRTNAAAAEGRAIAWMGGFIALAIGIGAVQLLPTADLASQSFRTKVSYAFASSYSFPPINLITLAVPRFFGWAREGGPLQYWGQDPVWEMWVYFGLLPLIVMPMGLAAAPARRRIPLLACAAIFLVLALGGHTPIYRVVYDYLPFFKLFRGPSKNIMITGFCLVTFSAWGFEALFHPAGGAADRRRLAAGLATGAVVTGCIALAWIWFIPGYAAAGSHWHRLIGFVRSVMGGDTLPAEKVAEMARTSARELVRAGLIAAAAVGLLGLAWTGRARRALAPLAALLILADTVWVFSPMLFKTYDVSITALAPELVRPLTDGAYPKRAIGIGFGPDRVNIAMHHGFSTPSGYAGNALERYNNFVNVAYGLELNEAQLMDPVNNYIRLLRFFAIDGLLVSGDKIGAGTEVMARKGDMALARAPEPFPRAFLAEAPQAMADPKEALVYVYRHNQELLSRPAVEQVNAPEAAPLGPGESARITAFAPNRVELEARAARERVLVLCEMFEKNWTATVNGKATPVVPANYLFRGVSVPEGESKVIFEYRPAAFRWGAVISLLSMVGMAGAGLGARKYRMRNAERNECGKRSAECAKKEIVAQKKTRKSSSGKTR